MPLSSETVTFTGSGIVFNNSYDAGVTDPVRAAIITAENYLQAHLTDAMTVSVAFNFDPGKPGDVATNAYNTYGVTYGQLVGALAAHATTADDRLAVAGLPAADPSNGAGFEIASGEGQVLGILPPSGQIDDTVTINSLEPWTFGSDLVGAVEHELSEGVFGRFQVLGLGPSGRFAPYDLFRFDSTGARDYTGGRDGFYAFFGVDGAHLAGILHDAINPAGVNDGFDLGDWDLTAEDAFGAGGGGIATSLSAVDLQALDVLGFTPSGAPPGSGPDDYADSFTDTAHAFGQVAVGAPLKGDLQAIGDHDWFKVQLNAGTDYVINLTGRDGGGGSLADSVMALHDATGAQIAINDDADPTSFDSRLVVHPAASGTYYIEAASLGDLTSGSFTLSVQAGVTASTPGNDVMVGAAAGGTLMGGAGDDTITADGGPTYLRGGDGDDVIHGGAGFDDINGNKGADTIDGGFSGDDWLVGGQGDDLIVAYGGHNLIYGNLGNDTLTGGGGGDILRGGQGDDMIAGGSGDDFISGDRGNDTESGGGGADRFHDSQDAGVDRVLDFHYAEGDRVQLDPGTTYTMSQVGADTVLDMGGGNQMILVGVTLADLPSDWIFLG